MPTKHLRPLLLGMALACGGALAQSDGGKAARFYEDALKRFERQDHIGAIVQLKNALQIDRNQLPARVLMGRAMLAKGEAANAELEFGEALRLGVNRAEVVVPLTQALAMQGKQMQVFEDARLQPTGLPAAVQLRLLLARASAYSDTGDLRNALRSIDEARRIDPGQWEVWVAEVPVRIRDRQFSEALAAAEQALKLKPDAAEAWYQKGSILHVQGDVAAAMAQYERAIKLDEGHVEAQLASIGILLDQGRDSDTVALMSHLHSVVPGEPRAIYLRALLAERAGNAAAAKAALQQVTQILDLQPIEALRYRPQMLLLNGMAHFGLNELAKAKPYLEVALRQQPNTPVAKLLAQAYMAEPAMARAEELLENYLKARPGDGQAMLMLASAQMALGRHGKATTLMQAALRAKDAPEFRTALGLSLLRSGQSADASGELQKAFKADPKQIFAGLALVNLYLRQGHQAKALAVADELTRGNPAAPGVFLVQGDAKLAARDAAGARRAFEQALKLAPGLLDAQLGLVRVDIADKALDAAGKRMKDILKGHERHIGALFEMAVLSEAAGRPDEVVKWLSSAVEASGQKEARANFALAGWYLRQGQPPQALDAAKQLLAKLPEDLDALQLYAQAQALNNDAAGARSTLANASRRAGYAAPGLVAIARQQLSVSDPAGAAYSLDKALGSAPDDLNAQVLMSIAELQLGDAAKSELRARQIVQAHPKRAIGYTLLADVASSRGQHAAALEQLRRAHEVEKSTQTLMRLFEQQAGRVSVKSAIELAEAWLRAQPKDLLVRKALGNALAGSGNYGAARKQYEAALTQQPSDTETLNNLANVLARLNDPGALQVAERAMARDPKNPVLVDTAGWASHLAGDKDRALLLLRDARLRDPGNPEIRYHLAVVLAQAGRKAEARDELEAAAKLGAFESSEAAKKLRETLN